MRSESNKIIILFDGVCNLCNASVRFLINRDKMDVFRFASIQSDAAKKILLHYHHKNNEMNSILVIDGDKILDESSAILHISSKLGPPWSWITVLGLLPQKWTDSIYKFVASKRYRWFGRKKVCTYSMDEYENRFILALDEPILE